jgi:leucyl aminopeptidase
MITVHAVGPRYLDGLDQERRELLLAQGFTAEVGEYAVLTNPTLEFFSGVGEQPTRSSVRRAIAALPLREGEEIDVVVDSGETQESDSLKSWLVAELIAQGQRVVGSDTSSRSYVWAVHEALAVRRAREWTNAPGEELTPELFARKAREIADQASLEIRVLSSQDLKDRGFGAILAVGQGSVHEPTMVDLRYAHPEARLSVALVGKGITFDTGGLSLKSPTAMAPMRMDKVGAASILAVMSVLPSLEIPVNVRALLPMAENMVGPTAVRPGDVVVGRSGVPITIVDTDFEGRVLLSDALTYAAEEAPDVIIDIAALTYQVVVALGSEIGGLFANEDELASRLLRAGEDTGDDLWRLPLAQRYRDQVVVAGGVKNHPEVDVGRAISAALFLQEFVPAHIAWAHLDITGPAWHGPASGPGATGFGVRALLAYLRDISPGTSL